MPGLKDLPHGLFGSGFGILPKDLDAAFVLPATAIPQGSIAPDQIGQLVRNTTGGTITAGTLLYISGWDAGTGLQLVTKAVATGRYTGATWVALASIPNNSSGPVGLHYQLTGQNTAAATVGDNVFLDVVAGGYVMTTPPGTANYYQVVGTVVTKSATGIINFDLESGVEPSLGALRAGVNIPTIGTAAGLSEQGLSMPLPGSLLSLFVTFTNALAASDTNYITFQVNNRALGAGNTNLLATSPAGVNTTKVTGGTAIAAYTPYPLVFAATPVAVNARDLLDFQATVTGTLANTVLGGYLLALFVPT